ncbi:hypothetical protein IQ254_10660 [Nodosilinea sp. LEGE 07088]|uniref:hypothetical protein n=1 Tax=Nodosilinea sp. LEGE 07088 TaxID=2777968 RepID=UPI001881B9DE|nr:hypothetical protein [Nodosilinea sp. LEGE 07088]MBE9137670.1 hypothetical protein [Nodosilinea sp. LEGE 07088]
MPIEVAIPLILSVATAVVVALRKAFADVTKAISLLTLLREDVKIALVGIEALRIVDTDYDTRARLMEQRLEDLERYLQLASGGQYPHPFQPRANRSPGKLSALEA